MNKWPKGLGLRHQTLSQSVMAIKIPSIALVVQVMNMFFEQNIPYSDVNFQEVIDKYI
ncbi:hypothetical protein ACFVSW_01740 [Neobacillus sp. NPDC058068]|uniref:hypothetical protein n=1 Tax=Neobacillus sp. NPDC058068 TaxID=3346325 RepID=UPI0036DC1370